MNLPVWFAILIWSGKYMHLYDCSHCPVPVANKHLPSSVKMFGELIAQFDKKGRVSVIKKVNAIYYYTICLYLENNINRD